MFLVIKSLESSGNSVSSVGICLDWYSWVIEREGQIWCFTFNTVEKQKGFKVGNDELPIMNENENDIDLGLSLGSTNCRVRTRLDSIGAGANANANSRVDMAFVASDPLSELVWSPQRGPSLKCADSNLVNKKPLILWNVRPSSDIHSPTRSIKSTADEDDRAMIGKKFILLPETGSDNEHDKATTRISLGGPSSAFSPSHVHCKESSHKLVEGARTTGLPNLEAVRNNREGSCSPKNVQIAGVCESKMKSTGQCITAHKTDDCEVDMSTMGRLSNQLAFGILWKDEIKDAIIGSQIMDLDIAAPSGAHDTKDTKASLSPLPSLEALVQPDKKIMSGTGEPSFHEVETEGPINLAPADKLESTAENDLHHLTAEVDRTSGEVRDAKDNSLLLERFPKASQTCLYGRKGKEKVLSGGDTSARLLNDEDDSHESVESCNSAGLFSKGKKRQNLEEESTVGRKRIRNELQDGNASTSAIRPDGSFMNWISNMVRGILYSRKEEVSCLANSTDKLEENNQEVLMRNTTDELPSRNMGFRTMFQSLYSPNSGKRAVEENYSIGEPKEVALAEKAFLEKPQLACEGDNDESTRQIIVSNGEVHLPVSRNYVCQSSEHLVLATDACNIDSAENKASSNRETGGVSPSISLLKEVSCSAEDTGPVMPLQSKAMCDMPDNSNTVCDMPDNSNPVGSLWITRLCAKTSRLGRCNQIANESHENSSHGTRFDQARVSDDFPADPRTVEARGDSIEDHVISMEKDKQIFASNSEASANLKSICKFNSVLNSENFKGSEAMASVFARRLDAFRYIRASGVKISACNSVTCYFCGRNGHDLRDCAEVTETELDDLLRNLTYYDRMEDSSRICIRCLQLDHWAITCPVISSDQKRQRENDAFYINSYHAGHLQICAGNVKHSSLLGREEGLADGCLVQSCKKPSIIPIPTNLTGNLEGSSAKGVVKNIASVSGNVLELKQNFPLFNIMGMRDAVPQTEMFHAIRKLRLSRVDVLRWMNSDVSLSHLNGFYLRLRLGKWESGMGGTGYYVACIAGAESESLGNGSKDSISVDVGGIKSFVGSQYVSNHDFLEDEIKAWRYRIIKTGGKLPSLDELRSKFVERIDLGF